MGSVVEMVTLSRSTAFQSAGEVLISPSSGIALLLALLSYPGPSLSGFTTLTLSNRGLSKGRRGKLLQTTLLHSHAQPCSPQPSAPIPTLSFQRP